MESKTACQITAADITDCIVSKSRGTVIDQIHPVTGRTVHYGRTLAEVIDEGYADAELMTLDEWCRWKAARQRTPIEWSETTAEDYDEMLGVLPPAAWIGAAFLVGEPWDHDELSGQPRFYAYRKHDGGYQVSSRPMTRSEFREAVS